MNTMRPHPTARLLGQDWMDQVFRAKAAESGGVVRRAIRDVEREVGLAAFELEVRRRGYHMVLCAGQAIVICNRGPIQMVC